MLNSHDKELANRLIKGTFLFETGINLSIMFCLESIMVQSVVLPRDLSKVATQHFQDLLSTNDLVDEMVDEVTEEYSSKMGDNAQHLDSILSLLDGPLSFEIALFFTILDPDFRKIILHRCLELATRYRGSISEEMAKSLVNKLLLYGERKIFSGRLFEVPVDKETRKELESDFMEYLGRYRASSQEEINDQKIRFNMSQEGAVRPSLPVGTSADTITDWRSFCRYSYLSNRFSIFPELVFEKSVALTTQESLFIPRPVEVTRQVDQKKIKTYDGIWYFRERLGKGSSKVLNVHGNRGNGLSAFARMLTVNLAMSYSRGTSKVIPVYLDLKNRTYSDLANLTTILDKDILHNVDELTFSWSMEPVILIFDNFDRVSFRDKSQRESFIKSLLDLAKILRKGGIVLMTDQAIETKKPGVEIETVSLGAFSEANIRDWIISWSGILDKHSIKVKGLNPDLVSLFSNPLILWQTMNFAWEDVLQNPLQGRILLLKSLFSKTSKASSDYIMKGERKDVNPMLLQNILEEIAWKEYSGQSLVNMSGLEEILDALSFFESPSLLTRISPARVLEIVGKEDKGIGFRITSEVFSDYLIATRFIKALKKKDILRILGRPLSESILKMVIEILEIDFSGDVEVYKKLRDTCWKWFNYPAVAVIPKKIIKDQMVFSDIEIFSDFRLFCFLVLTELTRSIGDEMPLNRGSANALSLLIKSLQSNEFSGRIDFKNYLANLNLKGVHFEDIDLAGAVFSNCKLDDAVFSRCNLEGADFSNSSLVGSRFNNCLLKDFTAKKADFTGCTVSYCDITGAHLREAEFKASSFINVSFSKCDLTGASMSKSSFNSSSFQNANINGGEFTKSDFQSVDFSNAKLVGTSFSNCNFSFCLFKETDMTLSSFIGSEFTNAVIVNSYMGGISAGKDHLQGFKLFWMCL